MQNLVPASTFIVVAALLAACGTPASTAPAADASAKPVAIVVETDPAPAAMGDVALILTITDAAGKPIEGANVDVSADHTDMSGMTMGGAATEQGPGKYAITANFSMRGNWVLTVYVRKGALDYREDIPLVLQ